jgi:3-oxoacyl-[acyl-carrier protein] reductase
MRLDGKTAIVTGGGSGFGRATAVRFGAEGAKVVIAELDEEGGRETARLVAAAGSQAEVVVGDISTSVGALVSAMGSPTVKSSRDMGCVPVLSPRARRRRRREPPGIRR